MVEISGLDDGSSVVIGEAFLDDPLRKSPLVDDLGVGHDWRDSRRKRETAALEATSAETDNISPDKPRLMPSSGTTTTKAADDFYGIRASSNINETSIDALEAEAASSVVPPSTASPVIDWNRETFGNPGNPTGKSCKGRN